jgi:rhodanese-related sulfurtransferase
MEGVYMKLDCINFDDTYSADKGPKLILDVREISEVVEGSLKNSQNIPLGELTERHKELPKDKTIYIHCRSGKRAHSAYDILTSLGFTKLVCIAKGGYADLETCSSLLKGGTQ